LKKLRQALTILLVAVVVLVIGVGGGAWLFARSSLPAYSAGLTMVGLDGEVRIYRDEYGVPHIFATTLNDLFFAQGYAQAQDRLWEMDLSRRAVQGRLAEIFGESYVDADHFLRTIGFYRAAEASVPIYPEEVAALGQAFADGVNAFMAQANGKWPIEFTILGYRPDPWVVTDSAAIGKYMSWVLGGNMQSELFYLAVAEALGPEAAAALFPVYPDDGPVASVSPFQGWSSEGTAYGPASVPALGLAAVALGETDLSYLVPAVPETGGSNVAAVLRLMELAETARLGLGPVDTLGLGSNNWVVAGRHTAGGKPLLANDMHLEIKAPSIWYQNHLSCPGELNVTGVIFPGVPGVIVGHNERVAWGVTNVGPDVQDLYVERPHPDDPYRFEYNGAWEEAQVYREEIRVKGQSEPVVREVIVTRHGPIISGVVGGEDGLSIPLALRWTALDPSCELGAVLNFGRAANWDDFKLALEQFKSPAQNFVFADIDGNIAYRANGLIPIRKAGSGLLPVPGWNSDYEWTGFIPWDELPGLHNPPSGLIVTANHRVTAPGYPYFLSHSWAPPYRAASIWQELYGRGGLTVEDMQAIQLDMKNLHASRLLPALEAALTGGGEAGAQAGQAGGTLTATDSAALTIMLDWARNNPRDLVSSPGPSIFHTFYYEALKATFADELGEELFGRFLGAGSPANTFDAMLLAGESPWFDDVTTPDTVETMADTLTAAFKRAVSKLETLLGGRPSSWEWGKIHTITFDHPMGGVALLRPLVNRGPYPIDGSGVTAAAMSFRLGDPPYAVESSAPWRFVADLADLNRCWDVVAIGASGQPLSPHYADQMDLWLNGDYKAMYFDRAEIEALPNVKLTVLTPGG
jgi:penicillin amidase